MPVDHEWLSVVRVGLAPKSPDEGRGNSKGFINYGAKVLATREFGSALDVATRGESGANFGSEPRIGSWIP
jgi:hypothetical protein